MKSNNETYTKDGIKYEHVKPNEMKVLAFLQQARKDNEKKRSNK